MIDHKHKRTRNYVNFICIEQMFASAIPTLMVYTFYCHDVIIFGAGDVRNRPLRYKHILEEREKTIHPHFTHLLNVSTERTIQRYETDSYYQRCAHVKEERDDDEGTRRDHLIFHLYPGARSMNLYNSWNTLHTIRFAAALNTRAHRTRFERNAVIDTNEKGTCILHIQNAHTL